MRVISFPGGAYLRRAEESDRQGLYRICLETGDSTQNASDLYFHKEMLGEIYVGPYLTLEPNLAWQTA